MVYMSSSASMDNSQPSPASMDDFHQFLLDQITARNAHKFLADQIFELNPITAAPPRPRSPRQALRDALFGLENAHAEQDAGVALQDALEDYEVQNEPAEDSTTNPPNAAVTTHTNGHCRRPRMATVRAAHPLLPNVDPMILRAERWRVLLCEEPFEWSNEQHELLWPYCDNLHIYVNKYNRQETDHGVTLTWRYRCRFSRRPHDCRKQGLDLKPNGKKISPAWECPFTIKKVQQIDKQGNTIKWIFARSNGHPKPHLERCTLDRIDRYRRSTALLSGAGSQVSAGKTIAEVWQTLQSHNHPLGRALFIAAGGKGLERYHVRNAGNAFRKKLSDPNSGAVEDLNDEGALQEMNHGGALQELSHGGSLQESNHRGSLQESNHRGALQDLSDGEALRSLQAQDAMEDQRGPR